MDRLYGGKDDSLGYCRNNNLSVAVMEQEKTDEISKENDTLPKILHVYTPLVKITIGQNA